MDCSEANGLETMNHYAIIIQRHWRSYRNRQLFRLLISVIQTLNSLPNRMIVQMLAPTEAVLFRDHGLSSPIVKFRLSGESFPPQICFKIHIAFGTCSSEYISGQQKLDATLSSVHGLLETLGSARYHSLAFQNLLTTTGRMYVPRRTSMSSSSEMQGANDEFPAAFGGKQNYWRLLDGQNLVRFSPTTDLVSSISQLLGPQLTRRWQSHVQQLARMFPGQSELVRQTVVRLLDRGLAYHKQRRTPADRDLTPPERNDWSGNRKTARVNRLRAVFTGQPETVVSHPRSGSSTPSTDEDHSFQSSAFITATTLEGVTDLYAWSQNLPTEQ